MKISLQISALIMFFCFNASAGAFPLVQVEHKSSFVVKIKMNKQCVEQVDRDRRCSFEVRKCVGQETGVPNNMSVKQIKRELGADVYNKYVRRCKRHTDYESCWDWVKDACSS